MNSYAAGDWEDLHISKKPRRILMRNEIEGSDGQKWLVLALNKGNREYENIAFPLGAPDVDADYRTTDRASRARKIHKALCEIYSQ